MARKYKASEQTHDTLIEATAELIAEVGFAGVTTRAVAARAGQNIGCIHYHFGGKSQLFEAVLRNALEAFAELVSPEFRATLESELETPEGQARAIRRVVRAEMQVGLSPDLPDWHGSVIYHAMQTPGSLCDIVFDEFVTPMTSNVYAVFGKVNPDFSKRELVMRHLLMVSCLMVHLHFKNPVLRVLGEDEYAPEYIQALEDAVVMQTTLYLGLPYPEDV